MPASHVRTGATFWCGLAIVYLAYSATFSTLAPAGQWDNRIFGSILWGEHDPGGFYLPSAHQIFEFEGRPLFPGHPGASLHLWLYGLQKAHYALAAPEELDFTAFTARRLEGVYVAAKISMTLLHIFSFFLLYKLARRWTNERASVLAVLSYATSLPVLHFLSRISVEPLMMIFFLSTLLSIVLALDRIRDERVGAAAGWAALAGVLSISGMATKLNFLGPLPFFALLYLVAGLGLRDTAGRWRLGQRALLGGLFILAAIPTALAYAQMIHFDDFTLIWERVAGAAHVSATWKLEHLLPASNAFGVFQLSEAIFIAVGIAGWLRLLANPSKRRTEAIWVSLYLIFAIGLWAIRVAWLDFRAFHYFFLAAAGLAIFFGLMGDIILQRAARKIPAAAGWLGVWVLIAVVHGAALVHAIESRIDDTHQYRGAPIFEIVEDLGPHDRVHVLRSTAPPRFHSGWHKGSLNLYTGLRSLDDIPGLYPPIRKMSCPLKSDRDIARCSPLPPLLHTEFNSLFVLVRKLPAESDSHQVVPGLGRVAVVRGDGPRAERD